MRGRRRHPPLPQRTRKMNGPDTPPGRSYAGTHNSPHNRIRASALGALALVVAVIAIGMSAQIRVETNSKRDARLLNLAGRQRMLSQRIARLGVTFVPGDDTAPLKTALSTMDAEAHTLHLLTDSILDRDGAHFAPLREQLLRADSSRGNVLRVAQALAETDNDAPRLRTQLLAATEQFLPIMNSAVNSAQSFSELQVTRSIAVARTAFLVTLAVAFLLALVVVEPLVQLVKRQHEANRKHNNELRRLSSVVEQTANAVFSTDTAGIITWVNDGFVRMTGFSAAEAVGNSPRSLLQSERTDTNTLKQIYDAIEAQVGVRVALINRSKDGRDFWMDVDIRPSCDDRGTITGFLAIGIDISEEVAQRERLALIFNTVSQGVILIDTNGLIVESNPAAARILGLSTDQLHARQTVDARWGNITLSGAPMAHQDLPTSITLQTGEPVTNNVHGFRLPDGSRRWVSVNTAAVRNVREEVTSVVASFTDVTDSIEQNTRMELVVSGANLGTWDVHVPTGHATYNSNFAAMLGYMIGELSPDLTLFEQSLHPDERDGVMQALNAHLNGESAEYRMEHRLRRKDGSYAWVIGAGRVTERGIAGEPVRMVGANVDISSTKELEARADLAQQRFDAAVDGTSDGLWTWEVGGDEIWFSPRCWTLLGYTGGGPHPALTPDAFNAALHPDNADAVLQLLQDVIIHGAPCDTEIRLRVLTGEYRHFRLRCKAQRDASERTVRVAGSIQDIEKQKLAEAKLHRATMLLEDAQSVARMGSWSFDFESGLIEWSRQVFELLGRDEREGPPASANVLDDYHEDDIAQLRAAAALATTHGLPYSLVMRTRMGHRGVRYVRAEGRARSDEQGNVSGLFGTVADITSEIEREEALKQARAELEDANGKLVETNLGLAAETGRANDMAQRANHANSAKSEFLANMSHEIRTPLTAILGYADILGEQLRARTDFADSLSAVDTIRRAGEHLLIVINDVLDLSKIDAGRVIVERIETSLPSVLSDVDTFMRTRAAEKGVQLRTTFLNDLPERIYSDPTRLRQILMNLVGNAVKFTDHGSVNVRVGAGGEASPSLCIEIEDTGLWNDAVAGAQSVSAVCASGCVCHAALWRHGTGTYHLPSSRHTHGRGCAAGLFCPWRRFAFRAHTADGTRRWCRDHQQHCIHKQHDSNRDGCRTKPSCCVEWARAAGGGRRRQSASHLVSFATRRRPGNCCGKWRTGTPCNRTGRRKRHAI